MMINKSDHNSFKSFLLKLLGFFAFVFFLDLVIGNMLKKYYFRQKSGFAFATTISIEQTRADIVIFGSSRAVNIFNPDIFEKQLGLSCHNAGRDGEPLFYHYAVLKSVLKRYTPKIVILSFDAGNFSIRREAYDRLAVLLPYYKNHPEMRPLIELKGPYEKLKMTSNIYPYNSLLIPVIISNLGFNTQNYSRANGFNPLKRSFSGPLNVIDYSKEMQLDSVKINAYESFIKDCINSNSKLYIVCPPYMIKPIGTDKSIITGKKIAEENNIDFLDYSGDSFFITKPALFADYRHLNETGADIFSNLIAEHVKKSE